MMGGKPSKTSLPDRPLVSIITVCLNSEKYLEQTIQSVINQTYDNIEYIIIDGGSTDGTLAIIKKYQSRSAYWVSEPDQGLYDAMNKGIALAKGELVGIINSDDWYQPKAVEIMVSEYFRNKESGVFFGDIEILFNEGKYRERVVGRPEEIGTPRWRVIHPAAFVSREIYRKWRYDLNFKISADYDFFLKLYFNGVTFHYCNKVIAYVRGEGKSSGYRTLIEEYRIRNKYFGKRVFWWNATKLSTSFSKKFIIQKVLKNNLDHKLLRWYRRMFRKLKSPSPPSSSPKGEE